MSLDSFLDRLETYDRAPSDVQPHIYARGEEPYPVTYGGCPEDRSLKDSGQREEFPSGMVRDIRTGKGRFDLISPYADRRLARHMEKGCAKYGERNWEKGCDIGRFLDSCKRHLGQWEMGETDEDHLAAAYWNLHCIVHFDEIEYGEKSE